MGQLGNVDVATCYRNYLEASGRGVLGGPPSGPSDTKRAIMTDLSHEQEEWRWVPGHEGDYLVSSFGRIMSLARCDPHIMEGTINLGYRKVIIKDKKLAVHRLVLLAFVGPPPLEKVCAHNDGNRLNNYLSNLRWATAKENQADAKKHGTWTHGENSGTAMVTEATAIEIYRLYTNGYRQSHIARKLDVTYNIVHKIVSGSSWRHLNLLENKS